MAKQHLHEIRAFNRFYTGIIGLLDEYILDSRFTLPEVRVLYELYHHEKLRASDIISLLNIDKGYLSRLINRFEKKKLLIKKQSRDDGRSSYIELTSLGKQEFEKLNKTQNARIETIVKQLTTEESNELLQNMLSIKEILTKVKI